MPGPIERMDMEYSDWDDASSLPPAWWRRLCLPGALGAPDLAPAMPPLLRGRARQLAVAVNLALGLADLPSVQGFQGLREERVAAFDNAAQARSNEPRGEIGKESG